ncbi:MAG: beta-ketoacyl synthase chain length factor [Rhodocyclales bacterium]|nr:beta-ketoacyl synthase chain length factor [Rhodocyclales bacterium]
MSIELEAWIAGIGVLAPGLADWPTARAVLAGERPYEAAPTVLPAPAILPPAERRRASRLVRLALAVGMEAVTHAGADAATLTTVFSASCGDGHNCHALCETLASDDRQVSPTRFHNSVHNTAAGYWGIATGAMAPCQVLCAYDASFGAGLIEAAVQVATAQTPVLLIAYDAEYPDPISAVRPTRDAAGVALLLTPQRSDQSVAELRLQLADGPAATLADPALEALRKNIPALRALPLLERIARGDATAVGIDYLDPLRLQLAVQPCRP